MMGSTRERREHYAKRLEQLRAIRSSWEPTWREISEQMIPYRVIWDHTDAGRGDRKESKIINNTPVEALKTLAAGMMAGITSPARKWFSLTLPDRKLGENKAIKVYLDEVQRIIESHLQTSGWYTALSNATYLDLGSVGTSAIFQEETDAGGIQFKPLPLGEYFFDINDKGDVDTCYRELSLSTRQIVKKFGVDNVSQMVKNQYDLGNFTQTHVVCHAISPNGEYKKGKLGAKGKKFASAWWEKTDENDGKFLRESGYDYFPVLTPRWSTRPGDAYGRGPGWEVRGDCKSLQFKESRLLTMLDLTVKPPMLISGNIRRASLIPGDRTHVPKGSEGMAKPMVEIAPAAMTALEHHIERDEHRIEKAFFVNLWQAMLNDDRNQRQTATEVEAKRQEIMLMLGPLLENLDNDLLEPAIENTFNILARNGKLPEPPEELAGQDVRVDFISIMHQMQQATGLSGIRTFIAEVGQLAQVRPEALDKLEPDVLVDELANITGVRPDSVLSNKEVEQTRMARAQQEKAQQDGEAMLAATQGAKNLSGVDPEKLSDIAQQVSPVAAAQGGALGGI